MEFAIIEAGTVINVIVADQEFIDTWYPGAVRVDQLDPKPGVGWTYDGTTFSPPEQPPPPPFYQAIYHPQDFRRRYTLDELMNIDNFVIDGNVSRDDQRKMTTIENSTLTAASIDLTDPAVIDAVTFQAQLGLITARRAADILDPNKPPIAGNWKF